MEKELIGKYTMPGIGFGTLGNVGDAGCALGAALYADRVYLKNPDRDVPDHPFWGPMVDGRELARAAREDGQIVTNGGRVMGVTGLGASIAQAKLQAYTAVKRIRWDGAWCRKDISDKAQQV